MRANLVLVTSALLATLGNCLPQFSFIPGGVSVSFVGGSGQTITLTDQGGHPITLTLPGGLTFGDPGLTFGFPPTTDRGRPTTKKTTTKDIPISTTTIYETDYETSTLSPISTYKSTLKPSSSSKIVPPTTSTSKSSATPLTTYTSTLKHSSTSVVPPTSWTTKSSSSSAVPISTYTSTLKTSSSSVLLPPTTSTPKSTSTSSTVKTTTYISTTKPASSTVKTTTPVTTSSAVPTSSSSNPFAAACPVPSTVKITDFMSVSGQGGGAWLSVTYGNGTFICPNTEEHGNFFPQYGRYQLACDNDMLLSVETDGFSWVSIKSTYWCSPAPQHTIQTHLNATNLGSILDCATDDSGVKSCFQMDDGFTVPVQSYGTEGIIGFSPMDINGNPAPSCPYITSQAPIVTNTATCTGSAGTSTNQRIETATVSVAGRGMVGYMR